MQQFPPVILSDPHKPLQSRLSTTVLIIGLILLVLISLGIGMLGYWWLQGLNATDAFLEASMILCGEGPFHDLTETSAKIFAGIYAMYSGILFLIIVAIIVTILWRRLTPPTWNK